MVIWRRTARFLKALEKKTYKLNNVQQCPVKPRSPISSTALFQSAAIVPSRNCTSICRWTREPRDMYRGTRTHLTTACPSIIACLSASRCSRTARLPGHTTDRLRRTLNRADDGPVQTLSRPDQPTPSCKRRRYRFRISRRISRTHFILYVCVVLADRPPSLVVVEIWNKVDRRMISSRCAARRRRPI